MVEPYWIFTSVNPSFFATSCEALIAIEMYGYCSIGSVYDFIDRMRRNVYKYFSNNFLYFQEISVIRIFFPYHFVY
ncbi:hypothetical protein NY2A_b398R [Paramecium bursaria Chlorella virus NY2A]|uniref:Uncharacterized protein b398R n=1 Tax=Paramecium bursaria Chlorella virus NY2A TaxID=46021 RepID=A7IWS3_PBCVN|nr:hypothetical protein NY2A_b398R [Paramecium bursaria Chlorella virus NY2A]ABT14797.1 hypothetical protein NY2A_b398R [Paramecium bursaria Chlorella virus NY2A]